ncbi:MAG: hypothetical protein JO104_02400, partial [Candidatus Eremiobacteraeota bacterium]|nr:hypothetical protein [Candidatus Eremiobacteraeota bacterium]
VDPSHFVEPPAGSYPIVGISYLLFYGNNNGVHLADKQTLITYVTSPSANGLLKKLEYAPMPTSIHTKVRHAANGTAGGGPHGAGHPCIQ